MVIALIGESCTGKSSIAQELAAKTGGKIYTGKDYLKLAKSEAEAKIKFTGLLSDTVKSTDVLIYVISEPEHLTLLPEGCLRVVAKADLGIIKERFSKRMSGNMPPLVAAMLEQKHGMFDSLVCDVQIENCYGDVAEACNEILRRAGYDI